MELDFHLPTPRKDYLSLSISFVELDGNIILRSFYEKVTG